MGTQNINSKLNEIASRLNTKKSDNKIRRYLDKIRQELETNQNRTDATKERRKQTLTNHELGNASMPIDPDASTEGQNYVTVRVESIRNLDNELRSVKRQFSDFVSAVYGDSVQGMDIPPVDMNDYSRSARSFKEQIAGAEDDFKVTVFRRGEPIYNHHIDSMNSSVRISEENINEFVESLDKVEKECQRASEMLRQVNVPNPSEVRDEIAETEAEMARQQFEEAEPFMNAQIIKRHFNTGDVFTAEDLADKVDSWSSDTAQSVIKSVVEEDYELGIKSVERGFKLTES